MKPVTLTIDLLKSKGACQTALTDFETTHGRMVTFRDPPTLARAILASGELLWFSENMLTGTIWDEYERQLTPLWVECECQENTIWDEYERQLTPIWSEYERQHAPIRAEYEHQRAPILAECVRQDNIIWDECDRQCATIVATLYFEQVSGMNRRPS